MTILVDTRQKQGHHDMKHQQIVDAGHSIQHIALQTGDYMLDGGNVLIDTKQDCTELYSNVVNDAARFIREAKRAFLSGQKLIILTEHGGSIKSLNDLPKWKPKYGKVSGSELLKRCMTIERQYGTVFLFCDKRITGKRIVELLSNNEAYV